MKMKIRKSYDDLYQIMESVMFKTITRGDRVISVYDLPVYYSLPLDKTSKQSFVWMDGSLQTIDGFLERKNIKNEDEN